VQQQQQQQQQHGSNRAEAKRRCKAQVDIDMGMLFDWYCVGVNWPRLAYLDCWPQRKNGFAENALLEDLLAMGFTPCLSRKTIF